MKYIPSHERRKLKQATALEYENASLRRRLSEATKALTAAEAALRDALQWESYVKQAFEQSARVGMSFFRKHEGTHRIVAEAMRRELAAAKPDSLYVPDRLYAKDQS